MLKSKLVYSIFLSLGLAAVSYSPTIAQEISQGDSPFSQQKWRKMTTTEKVQEIESLINSPMGIAALNQVALEGFVGFDCQQSFYVNEELLGFQSIMRVKCSQPKGISVAIAYEEIRVIFNRFEGNIEDFEIERISEETGDPKYILP